MERKNEKYGSVDDSKFSGNILTSFVCVCVRCDDDVDDDEVKDNKVSLKAGARYNLPNGLLDWSETKSDEKTMRFHENHLLTYRFQ